MATSAPNKKAASKRIGRPRTSNKEWKVALPERIDPMLDALVSVGLFGATPTEVIRYLVLDGLNRKLLQEKILDSGAIALLQNEK